MKRKLNDQGVPEPAVPAIAADDKAQLSASFSQFELDSRLLLAISQQKYAAPTDVQTKTFPLALDGKDLIVRARTGSGKTVAYLLPILQSILRRKSATSTAPQHTTTLILVPTKELASQVTKAIHSLTSHCSRVLQAVNLTSQAHELSQKALLAASPDIVVATPARACQHLNSASLVAENLLHLVVDEADLILSYGYEDDFKTLVKLIPHNVQTVLASATLTPEVDILKGLLCEDPTIVDIQETEEDARSISQYVVKSAEDDKFLLLFALFKLKLVKGKCIIFVGDVDRCYRIKLYLEQFGIRSCVLNSELPVNCRIHVVEEFNKGVYDVIIAADEHEVVGDEEQSEVNPTPADGAEGEIQAKKQVRKGQARSKQKKMQNTARRDKEFGISRGIDFQNVTCVLNFDLPTTSKSYTHRIGRTARAGQVGIAISLVVPTAEYRKHKLLSFPSTANDEIVLERIHRTQKKRGHQLQPYDLDMKKLEGFKYRVASALKAVSLGAIKEARLRELRQEMLKSEKLKRHLEENPEDAKFLRHDMELKPAKIQPHMKHVPDYLMGGASASSLGTQDAAAGLGAGFVALKKQLDSNRLRNSKHRASKMRRKGGGSGAKHRSNPLKSFKSR